VKAEPTEGGRATESSVRTYRDLEAWQEAVNLVEAAYRTAADLPNSERFGLASQMQRSAVSVPANIAEGYGRKGRGEFLRHLRIARGSLMELETHLLIAQRLTFVTRERLRPVWRLAQTVGRLLNGLIRAVEAWP